MDAKEKYWRRILKALNVAGSYGMTDGEHHKQLVIDQMVRALTAEDYEAWGKEVRNGEDGPESYSWGTGTPP